jgi:hypothetical protein
MTEIILSSREFLSKFVAPASLGYLWKCCLAAWKQSKGKSWVWPRGEGATQRCLENVFPFWTQLDKLTHCVTLCSPSGQTYLFIHSLSPNNISFPHPNINHSVATLHLKVTFSKYPVVFYMFPTVLNPLFTSEITMGFV